MHVKIPEFVSGNVIETLRNCNGVYECPMSAEGKALGPLVGYAGQYETADGRLLNYVGFVYYFVGRGDQWPHVAKGWARPHAQQLAKFEPTLLLAAPMGGVSYGSVLKQRVGCRGIFVDKKVLQAAEVGKREKSKLVLGRYDIYEGDRAVVIEDITNNFSTAKEMNALAEAAGATVVAIACVINRSDKTVYWRAPEHDSLPVIALQHRPTPQYRQDDPVVREYIEAGQVIWKPKERWAELVAIEAAYAKRKYEQARKQVAQDL